MKTSGMRTFFDSHNARYLRLLSVTILVALAVSFARRQAWAENSPTVLGLQELQTVYSDLIVQNSIRPGQDFEIANFSAAPESISLPTGPREVRIISQSQPKPAGRQTFVVDILVGAIPHARVTLSGDLELYGQVVCATKALSRHAIVAESDVELVRRNLNMLGPDVVADPEEAIGREMKTTLQVGAILYSRFLKSPETVKRGDVVSIMATTGSLTVSVPGRVQTAGATGDLIKVKNLMSRREVFARVISPDTVQVEL